MKCDSLRSIVSAVTLSSKLQLLIEWHWSLMPHDVKTKNFILIPQRQQK